MSEKEYIVVLKKGVDFTRFHEQMLELQGRDGIPNRQVEVANEWVTMHTIVTDAIILSPADEPRARDWIRSLRVATLGST